MSLRRLLRIHECATVGPWKAEHCVGHGISGVSPWSFVLSSLCRNSLNLLENSTYK